MSARGITDQAGGGNIGDGDAGGHGNGVGNGLVSAVGFQHPLIADLTPVNRALLRRRDELQAAIDEWHRTHAGQQWDAGKYRAFLDEIGYLAPGPPPLGLVLAPCFRDRWGDGFAETA